MLLNSKSYILLFFMFLLGACFYDNVDPPQPEDYISKLVVNAELNTTSTFALQLTNSASVSSDDLPGLVKTATVNLARNQETSVMAYDQNTEMYLSNIIPQPGDRISLDIRATGYPFVTSFITVPNAVSTTSTLVVNGGVDSTGQASDLLTIQFQDDPNEKNYYRLNFYYYDNTFGEFDNMAFSTNDPSLAQYNSYRLYDGSVLFDDELFNGQLKSISTVAPFGYSLW